MVETDLQLSSVVWGSQQRARAATFAKGATGHNMVLCGILFDLQTLEWYGTVVIVHGGANVKLEKLAELVGFSSMISERF